MEKNIEAAVTWLCESDILNKDQQKGSFGGINNGYMWRDKTFQYVYHEITGYAINAFLSIGGWLGEDSYLQHAINAADYLIQQQGSDDRQVEFGAVLHSLTLPELKAVACYYSFDNAVILHAMTNLYMSTHQKKYELAAEMIAKWLLGMQKVDGSFYAHYDAAKNVIEHPCDEFFYDCGCLHVKNAIGLLAMQRIDHGMQYYNAAMRLCDWGETLLDSDGLFWANTRKKYVFTHAHCYATEGYLYAYYHSRDKKYLDIARKASQALIGLQNADGSLYRIYKHKPSMKKTNGDGYRMSFSRWRTEKKHPWKTIDATAQAARIWALFYSLDRQERYLTAANKAIDFIKANQVLDTEDRNMYGGFYYQFNDTIDTLRPRLSGGMYTWCTQFGLSAMMIVKSAEENRNFDELIENLF